MIPEKEPLVQPEVARKKPLILQPEVTRKKTSVVQPDVTSAKEVPVDANQSPDELNQVSLEAEKLVNNLL